MSRYHVTPRAARDLAGIADWTLLQWGPSQMKAYMSGLEHRFRWLADHPKSGRPRDDVARSYRSFPEGRHLVFYKIGSDGIAIIGVLHQSMDPGAALD